MGFRMVRGDRAVSERRAGTPNCSHRGITTVSIQSSLVQFNLNVSRYNERAWNCPKTVTWAPTIRYILTKLERLLSTDDANACSLKLFFPGKEVYTSCEPNYTVVSRSYDCIVNKFAHNVLGGSRGYYFLIEQRTASASDRNPDLIERIAAAAVTIFSELSQHARLCRRNNNAGLNVVSPQVLEDAQEIYAKLGNVAYRTVTRRYTTGIWFKIPSNMPKKLHRFLPVLLPTDDISTVMLTPEQRWACPPVEQPVEPSFAYPVAEYLARNVSEDEHRVLLEALTSYKQTHQSLRSRSVRRDYATCDTLLKKIYPEVVVA